MKKLITLSLCLLLAACGAGEAGFGGGGAGAGAGTSAGANDATHVLVYSVDGPISRASVTYQNDQGGIAQEIVNVPWKKQFVVIPGQPFSLSAQNQDSAGYLTVGIAIDGAPYKQATALGAFATATTAGSCC
ncbi:hypothetical protein [Actimicrobium sp. CCI2.3]|uniref:hypothetical protein n=1 Tax=Actimicrobium sp. CCI2.3 TaxID=3048616 RepID=UPI002AB59644|nr:hypothetical protein [Actimicrobium sp. CCI2.3]MDY7575326.1 hypothetical protein [Actimicrobium sp. CCI2.3]MEB0023674.1 hypothetical protein [Actimicrobium sp. CCI2.3]